MYDNGDLSLSKIQEVVADDQLRTVDEEEGSRALSTGSRKRGTSGQPDILAKLKEANNRYGQDPDAPAQHRSKETKPSPTNRSRGHQVPEANN